MSEFIETPRSHNKWTRPATPAWVSKAMENPGRQVVTWEKSYNHLSANSAKFVARLLASETVQARTKAPGCAGFQVQSIRSNGVARVIVTYHC